MKPHAVRDFYWLGKFKPGTKKPRPLLVMFLRSADPMVTNDQRG